jgi:hypothetical protein
MRIVALVEALVLLLASVAAYGSPATGQSVRLGTAGAATDKPICTWEQAPAQSSLLADQIARKEASWSQQGAKPGKITAVVAVPGGKAGPSRVPSAASSVGIAAVVSQPSLLSLCCLLIV